MPSGIRAELAGLALLMTLLPMRVGAAEPPIDPELLAARETAWRAFFAGDVKTLGDLLPADFIGINMGDSPFSDRAHALDDSKAFAASGGRLVSLSFPETRAQQVGDVVILYGRFELVLNTGGVDRTMRGRLTEVFVKRNGKWVHPGWHLDVTSTPPRAE